MPSRAGPPRSRACAAALLVAAPLACAAPSPPPPSSSSGTGAGWVGPGDRDPAPGSLAGAPPAADSSASPDPPAPPTPWELAAEMPRFAPAAPRGRSQHFTGELEAEVRVNPAAAGYPELARARALPTGAALLAPHFAPGRAEPVVLLAMVKRPPGYDTPAGDWEYLVLTPAGEATHRGRLPLCKRCHAEAPRDHVFGGPR